MKITSAYSSIANGGFMISPRLIDVTYDNSGKTIFKGDKRKCVNCSFENSDNLTTSSIFELPKPEIKHGTNRIFSEDSAIK